jgi:dihydropteroate synthase
LLAGVSRKGFLRRAVMQGGADGDGVDGREAISAATHVACAAAILGGAHVLRVHDVLGARAAAAVTESLLRARRGDAKFGLDRA